MKVTQDEVVDSQTVLNIELEDHDLDPYLERGYRSVVDRLKIPGFRKGKAPRRIVESFVGRQGLLSEVLEFMLTDATSRAVTEREIETAGPPKYDLVDLEPVSFTATVAIKPDVDLGDYRTIRVDPASAEVTQQDVDAEVEQLRDQMALWEPVERASAIGDMITVNIEAAYGEKKVLDQQGASLVLNDGEGERMPGLSENLAGLKEDGETEFELTLPEDFGDKEAAGKAVKFKANVTGVKEKVLPDPDDDFAAGVGRGYDSMDDLREDLEGRLQDMRANAEGMRLRNEAVKSLVDGALVQVPPMLTEHRVEHLMAEREQGLTRMGMTMENYLAMTGSTREQAENDAQEAAHADVKRAFVLEKLGDEEAIEASDTEIDERLEALIASSGRKVSNRDRRRLNSAESREDISRSIRNEKTLERLVELVATAPSEGDSAELRSAKLQDETVETEGESDD